MGIYVAIAVVAAVTTIGLLELVKWWTVRGSNDE